MEKSPIKIFLLTLFAGLLLFPVNTLARDSGEKEDPSDREALATGREAEETAIQNNSALRRFYLKRYALIFRGELMSESSAGVFIDRGFGDPLSRHYSSGQKIFRDNYIARQIENFSAELRASLNRLDNSRQTMREAEETLQDSGGGDFVPGQTLKDSLREISSSSSVLRKIIDPVLPSMPDPRIAAVPDDISPEDFHASTIVLDRKIASSLEIVRNYFYSSHHTVSVKQLSLGDICTQLKMIEEEADSICKSIPDSAE